MQRPLPTTGASPETRSTPPIREVRRLLSRYRRNSPPAMSPHLKRSGPTTDRAATEGEHA
jgi:hypothetical protein